VEGVACSPASITLETNRFDKFLVEQPMKVDLPHNPNPAGYVGPVTLTFASTAIPNNQI
jgi:hypothetical protein